MSKKRRKPKSQTQQSIGRVDKNLSKRSVSDFGLWVVLLIAVCVMVLAAHWPVLSAQALSFDDNEYLVENSLVQNPSWASAKRFLTEVLRPSTVRGYYQPLTMISLMLDYAFGGRPDNLRAFHTTSICLHLANTLLVIVLLFMLFEKIWPAAIAGLLFGVHPLSVEPIAWIAERKTLLAAFLALWCLIFYVRYAQKGNRKLYGASVVTYVLSLMAKPTSIPLPFLMLLLDYWPLRRLSKKAILEKIPLLVIGVIFGVVIFISQSSTFGVTMPEQFGLQRIVLIVCHNIFLYLSNIAWPANLSLFYPYPVPMALSHPDVLAGVLGTLVLIVVLIISLRWTRVLLAGWLFFFVAIFPTMGIIGVHGMIAADRHVYLPFVGILLALVYLLCRFCNAAGSTSKRTARQTGAIIVAVILVALEFASTRQHISYWKDTETHRRRMLAMAPNNHIVNNSLAVALVRQGKLGEAISFYRRALQIKPDYADTHQNLGRALYSLGKLDEAMEHFRQAIKFKPDFAASHSDLGTLLAAQGRFDEAIKHYQKALQSEPQNAELHYKLGAAFQSQGRFDEAINSYRKALHIKPDDAVVHSNIGAALSAQGKLDEGISHFRKALQLKPDSAEVHHNLGLTLIKKNQLTEALEHFQEAMHLKPDTAAFLNSAAWILATHPDQQVRNPKRAIEFAERAAELTQYKNAAVLDTLAASYAADGQFDKAITTAETALKLVSGSQAKDFENQIQKRLELYQQSKPYQEPGGNGL